MCGNKRILLYIVYFLMQLIILTQHSYFNRNIYTFFFVLHSIVTLKQIIQNITETTFNNSLQHNLGLPSEK